MLLRKKQQNKEARRKNRERIDQLSKPRRCFFDDDDDYEDCFSSYGGKPLELLLPRLSILAAPKLVTPKYEKPKEEPIVLPGKIKDWESLVNHNRNLIFFIETFVYVRHKKWLEKRAKPRQQKKTNTESQLSRKITLVGMKRIQELAKPRSLQRWHRRPLSRNNHPSFALANARICKLSEPRIRVEIDFEHRPLEHVLKISKSAMNYEATERIISLATPKRSRFTRGKKSREERPGKQYFCCFRTISCDEHLFNENSANDRKLETA